MSPALFNRDRPETTTIAAALAGIADLVDRIGSGNEPAARHTAVNSVRRARVAMEQAGRTEHHRLAQIVESTEALLEAALRSTVEETSPRLPTLAVGWGPVGWSATLMKSERAAISGISARIATDSLARAVEDLHNAVIG